MTGALKLLFITLLLAGSSGCGWGQSARPLTTAEVEDLRLRDVGELYRTHQQSFKKPPRSLKDFIKLGDAAALTGFEAIREKQIIVRWNATLPDTNPEPTSPPSGVILAYAKEVPERGGSVMTLDRRIRHMTPEEFKAAKLAGAD